MDFSHLSIYTDHRSHDAHRLRWEVMLVVSISICLFCFGAYGLCLCLSLFPDQIRSVSGSISPFSMVYPCQVGAYDLFLSFFDYLSKLGLHSIHENSLSVSVHVSVSLPPLDYNFLKIVE